MAMTLTTNIVKEDVTVDSVIAFLQENKSRLSVNSFEKSEVMGAGELYIEGRRDSMVYAILPNKRPQTITFNLEFL